MNIIIAEDNPVSSKLMQKMLERENFTSHVAKDGKEALELLKTTKSRIVVSDWIMPEMDGISLCREIRKKFASPYIYIILLTSKSNIEDTVSAFDAGADDYIIKPFNPKELAARIRAGKRTIDLEDKYEKATVQLLHSEKMAAVGQLSAGIAHEINNPTGFVKSNLETLQGYLKDLIAAEQKLELLLELNSKGEVPVVENIDEIKNFLKEIDINFLIEDIPDLLNDCIEGTNRISKIVTDMKNFAHPGSDTAKLADINNCIDSTLNVIWNDIKYKASVIKNYGQIPSIYCFPQKLNQVFMNIVLNASQAIEEKGVISIKTYLKNSHIIIEITDNGQGIPPENLPKIFDPFFTTKPIGKGTGLGLNVAYNIIKMHNGTINAKSKLGKGTLFLISLPIKSKPTGNDNKNGD
ncbi:MAG: response regulator [Desulfobacteraceae bacterium]|nr:response regulator [Desulfobacteraceae bacterium]